MKEAGAEVNNTNIDIDRHMRIIYEAKRVYKIYQRAMGNTSHGKRIADWESAHSYTQDKWIQAVSDSEKEKNDGKGNKDQRP